MISSHLFSSPHRHHINVSDKIMCAQSSLLDQLNTEKISRPTIADKNSKNPLEKL